MYIEYIRVNTEAPPLWNIAWSDRRIPLNPTHKGHAAAFCGPY